MAEPAGKRDKLSRKHSRKPSTSSKARMRLGEIRKLNPLRAKSDFICRYKCNNTLPDIPLDPKLLKYPFDPMRYVRRSNDGSNLEKCFLRAAPILTEPDLGVPIDLVDPGQYTVTGNEPELHPTDRELIEGQTDNKDGDDTVGAAMPWFISTQYVDSNVTQNRTQKEESILSSPTGRQLLKEEETPEARAKIVEQTFEDAAKIDADFKAGKLVHKDKPGVTAVEVAPLLPDIAHWANPYIMTCFDEPPPTELRGRAAHDGAEVDPEGKALIQGLEADSESWMAYLMPVKRKAVAEEGQASEQSSTELPAIPEGFTEYRRLRSYSFEKFLPNKETLLLYKDEQTGDYLYKTIDSFFRLQKRRKTEDTDETQDDRDSLLVARHDPTEQDLEEERQKRQDFGMEIGGTGVEDIDDAVVEDEMDSTGAVEGGAGATGNSEEGLRQGQEEEAKETE